MMKINRNTKFVVPIRSHCSNLIPEIPLMRPHALVFFESTVDLMCPLFNGLSLEVEEARSSINSSLIVNFYQDSDPVSFE